MKAFVLVIEAIIFKIVAISSLAMTSSLKVYAPVLADLTILITFE